MILVPIFLGNFDIGKLFFMNSVWRAMGKLTFETALIYPLVIVAYVAQSQMGFYLTTANNLMTGFGNIASCLIFGTFVYILVEYPSRKIIQYTVMPMISHDENVRNYLAAKNFEMQ